MLRVFFDTSVLYPAVHSATGTARELFRLALDNRLHLVVSEDILLEAESNISEDIPRYLASYHAFLTALTPEILPSPPLPLVREVEAYLIAKDAPIIAAAIQAHPDYLVSFDRKHILKPEVATRSGLRIVMPDVVLHAVRAQEHRHEDAA